MKNLHISLDLGRVVLNNHGERVPYGKTKVCLASEGCLPILHRWSVAGHRLSVISKIDRYHEARVTMSLVYNGIVPSLIDPLEVRYCYERSEKGSIAATTQPDVHVDDRIEALESIHKAGIRWKILFIGHSDDRPENGPLSFGQEQGLFIAANWTEVEHIVANLPYH